MPLAGQMPSVVRKVLESDISILELERNGSLALDKHRNGHRFCRIALQSDYDALLNEVEKGEIEMVDANKYYFDLSNPDKPILKIILPIQTKIQCLQEKFGETQVVCDFSIPFVDEYMKSKYYDKSRKILVIKAGVGGTGFCKQEWGKDCFLYKRLCDMVEKALSFNEENRLVAFLWHQGECDVAWGKTGEWYGNEFVGFISEIRSKYGIFPVLAGDFSKDWALDKDNVALTSTYTEMFKNLEQKIEKYGFVPSDNLESNARAIGNDDTIHFSRKGQLDFGKRYFEIYQKLYK